MQQPTQLGVIKSFCRERGHGFVVPDSGGEPLFVHISDIEGDYIPKPGDQVSYKRIPVPPKNEKFSAVHVQIVHLAEGQKHETWDAPVHHD
jgi:cold shock CspA family protein